MFLNRATSSSKGTVVQFCIKKDINQVLSPKSCDVVPKKFKPYAFLQENGPQGSLVRFLHVTNVKKDIESGLRAIGTGAAATGVIGPGIGIGIIFGNLLGASARNPSVANKLFGNAIMGAAFCESLGLFAIVIGFVVKP